MFVQLSNGIEITVKVEHKSSIVPHKADQNIFMYIVGIKNTNDFAVQLTRRRWLIFDAKEFLHEVEGPGVVGATPILNKNESYTYSSWTTIKSQIGYMEGFYTMVNLETQKEFLAKIPRFDLFVPDIMN